MFLFAVLMAARDRLAAGPHLVTDWVGGGIDYVNKVIAEGPTSTVMVKIMPSSMLTTDGGRHWYQFLYPASDW